MSTPHNPERLTEAQYGRDQGYRLLEVDEIDTSEVLLDEIEVFAEGEWGGPARAWWKDYTYRTKLSREALAAARGLTPKASEPSEFNFEAFKEWLHSDKGPSMKHRDGCDADFGYWLSQAFLAGQRSEGTLEGHNEMQRWRAEADEAWYAYIKVGICSYCKATSAKEAETKCRPSQDQSGEYSCPGESLWNQ